MASTGTVTFTTKRAGVGLARPFACVSLDPTKASVSPASGTTASDGTQVVTVTAVSATTSAVAVRLTADGQHADCLVSVAAAAADYTTRGLVGLWRPAATQPLPDGSGNGYAVALGSTAGADSNDPTYGSVAGSGAFLRYTTDDFARVIGPRFSIGSIQCVLRKGTVGTGTYLYGWCEQDGSGVDSDSDKTLMFTATGVQFDCYLGGPKSLSAALATGTTAHVRAVADGTNLTLYVNDVQQAQIACGPTFDAWGAGAPALTIGARHSSATTASGLVADGYLGDMLVHNVAPTSLERATDYAAARAAYPDLP